ncbi:MAG: hypothetical protein CM1200mP36_01840 [Gammaproteobacteria bacterium]|nr:MAG: hypothetical protein CM1200mP36_01840 [Gammaproteobacteria bacterium]
MRWSRAYRATEDAKTRVSMAGGEARIYRGVLYFFSPGVGSGGIQGRDQRSMPWLGPEGSLLWSH